AALLLARLLRVLTAVLVLAPRILSRLLIAIAARILLILITHEVVLRNMPPDRIISRCPIRSIVFSARCRTRISRGLGALDLCSAIVFALANVMCTGMRQHSAVAPDRVGIEPDDPALQAGTGGRIAFHHLRVVAG